MNRVGRFYDDFSGSGLDPTQPGLYESIGKRQIKQSDEKRPKENKSDYGQGGRQPEFLFAVEIHVRKNDDWNRNRKPDQPTAKEEREKPCKDVDGALERNIRRNILTHLDVYRRGVVRLTLDAFQIENDLDEGENDHRDTDGPRIQPRLHAPIVRLVNENAEKN
jgi:hypothetical protein